jgi:hypothetical protein
VFRRIFILVLGSIVALSLWAQTPSAEGQDTAGRGFPQTPAQQLQTCKEELREQIAAYRRAQQDGAMTMQRYETDVRGQVQDLLSTKATELAAVQQSYDALKQRCEAPEQKPGS